MPKSASTNGSVSSSAAGGSSQKPQVVDARQCHVGRADHQRDHPVGEAGGGRHECREDHHQRVHADQLVEELRLHELQPGLEEFHARTARIIAPPTKNISSARSRYIVPMSLWLVVVSQRRSPPG
jgi:hypothetical protein